MAHTSIIFFGRNPSIMALVKNQLQGHGFDLEGYLEDEQLMQRLGAGPVDLVVVGGGIEDGPRLKLRDFCAERGIRLLEHFGGPDQLLENVRHALA